MINKYAAALFGALLVSPASAQFDPFGSGRSQPAQSQSAGLAALWAAIPKDQMSCLQAALRRASQPEVPELIARNLGPSAPPAANHLLRCKIDREESASADKAITPFVRWLDSQLASKPALATAFDQCSARLSAYQKQLLNRLRSQASASASRSQQDALNAMVAQLSADQYLAVRVGCIKSFLASLQLVSPFGHFADELASLGGKLTQANFDLTSRAQAKLDDLTDQGTKQFLSMVAFENIPANELRMEVEMAATQPKGTDYLACFLPNDWVFSFSSNASCHNRLLEKSLAITVQQAVPTVR